MTAPVDSRPPLADEASFALLRTGFMVTVASRDAAHIPSVARALGCRVSPDRTRVTVVLLASQSAALLADLRATGVIAVVFTQPSTHRTIQLKGSDATVGAPEPGAQALVEANAAAALADLALAGYPESFARTLFALDPPDLVAVGFTPTAAFFQTPGPQAGKRL
jgi:hypothetical protein